MNAQAQVSPEDMPILRVGIECTLTQLLDKGFLHAVRELSRAPALHSRPRGRKRAGTRAMRPTRHRRSRESLPSARCRSVSRSFQRAPLLLL